MDNDDTLNSLIDTFKKLMIIAWDFISSSIENRDNKKFALVLSILVPGTGLIYWGNTKKGLEILIAYLLMIPLRIFTHWGMFFASVSFVIWLYSLYATHMETK